MTTSDDRLWPRQIAAVLRLELRKSLVSMRAAPTWLLAALPVAITGFVVVISLLVGAPGEISTPAGAAQVFAYIFQFILRFVVYAGCLWVFMNLFRGEILDRSLHYYFLTPIRREVLVVGKFLAGLFTAGLLFVCSAVTAMAVLFLFFGPQTAAEYLLRGPGTAQALTYGGITFLACLGYGAVFLVVGLFLRNPIVPALLIWAWEAANPFLPSLLKKISVVFYLQSLIPVAIAEGPLAIVAQPVSAWLAVPGVLLFTALMLGAAALRIRKLEIAYGAD